jgi:hypothetical protein
MELSDEVTQIDSIHGERRSDRRYGIRLDLRWKLIRRRRALETGLGHTLNLSSGGILFDSGRQLPVGLNVELAISWPVLLRDKAPMQLIVSGRIIRSGGDRTAVAMSHHEFRTLGAIAGQRVPPGNSPHSPHSPLLASGTNGICFPKFR